MTRSPRKKDRTEQRSPLGVRMQDVAERAGVSRATVSRVLAGDGTVSAATGQRVERALQELGYVPNRNAQGLAGRTTPLVGLLMRNPAVPAYGRLHLEAQVAARAAGVQLIAAAPARLDRGEGESELLRGMLGLRVNGLLVATGVLSAHQLDPFLDEVPVVSVGRLGDHPGIYAVSYDEDTGGATVATQVYERGHRSVAVIVPKQSISLGENRRGMAMAAHLEARGATVHRLPAVEFGTAGEGGDQILELVRERAITAALFTSDQRAIHFLERAQEIGLAVPAELSVTGFDGIAPGLKLMGLASMQIPVAEVAQRAIQVITQLIAGTPTEIEQEVFTGRFIDGPTLGPPPSA